MRVVIASSLLIGFALFVSAAPLPQCAAAAPAKSGVPTSPQELGKFEDWIAATYQESGQTVCYAFTRAKNSTPVLPNRGEVLLTVTERPTGRDAVTISAGFAYAPNAAVTLQVDQAGFNFYTAQRDAFAREGRAAAAAFQKAGQALARSPGPREGQLVVDTFSMKGFSAAYAAISKACPAGRG